MDITIDYGYSVHGVVPPRCRKPRTVFEHDTMTVTVSEVTSDEAPVAFRIAEGGAAAEYRLHGGSLYLPFMPWAHQEEPTLPGSKQFPAEVSIRHTGSGTAASALADVRKQYADGAYLVIDGVVWKRAKGEPMYEVIRFGIGSNHGGTALMHSDYVNPNLGSGAYYNANQYKEAVAAAVARAEERGDDLSIESIRAAARIEVLIPEAVSADPQSEYAAVHEAELVKVELTRAELRQISALMPGSVAKTAVDAAIEDRYFHRKYS